MRAIARIDFETPDAASSPFCQSFSCHLKTMSAFLLLQSFWKRFRSAWRKSLLTCSEWPRDRVALTPMRHSSSWEVASLGLDPFSRCRMHNVLYSLTSITSFISLPNRPVMSVANRTNCRLDPLAVFGKLRWNWFCRPISSCSAPSTTSLAKHSTAKPNLACSSYTDQLLLIEPVLGPPSTYIMDIPRKCDNIRCKSSLEQLHSSLEQLSLDSLCSAKQRNSGA